MTPLTSTATPNEALDLIKKMEGLRLRAYRDIGGVWTIGYGHTSAGGPPEVGPRLTISRERAEQILLADASRVAGEIRPYIDRKVTKHQFAALLCFAYNVGTSNFRRSSVLAAVNAGDFAAVPRRLALWNKVGGRSVPGLIRRRAEEAALFACGEHPEDARDKMLKGDIPPGPLSEPRGKPQTRSTINVAAILSALAGLLSTVTGMFRDIGSLPLGHWTLPLMLVILVATMWIIRERRYKSELEGI
jgi:GH24 family phage-related lysozyme (muramidase)